MCFLLYFITEAGKLRHTQNKHHEEKKRPWFCEIPEPAKLVPKYTNSKNVGSCRCTANTLKIDTPVNAAAANENAAAANVNVEWPIYWFEDAKFLKKVIENYNPNCSPQQIAITDSLNISSLHRKMVICALVHVLKMNGCVATPRSVWCCLVCSHEMITALLLIILSYLRSGCRIYKKTGFV